MLRRKPLKRKVSLKPKVVRKPIRKVNPERKERELLRTYGPPERRKWMKERACFLCGRYGVDQAHVPSHSGAGRKGDAKQCIPLCRTCHSWFDLQDITYRRSFQDVADLYETMWQAHCNA